MNNVARLRSGGAAGWALVALTWLAGCGAEPTPGVALRFDAPWPSSLVTQTCAASFDGLLSAELRVGGHVDLDCPLDIVDRVATGGCSGITTGIVRPVALVWIHPDPAGGESVRPLPLAYFLTYVDLVKTSLEGGQETVTVSFVDDDEQGVFLTEQAALDQLVSPAPEDASELDDAKAWLIENGREENGVLDLSLDHDDDTCRNLTEACNGTAVDPDHDYGADPVLYPCDP